MNQRKSIVIGGGLDAFYMPEELVQVISFKIVSVIISRQQE
jgi:hypothetical protein